MDRTERYEAMTREEMAERLSAAEDVCLMFGWAAFHDDTDRNIAAYLLWRRWHDLAGRFTAPAEHPHLTDKAIEPMVREYTSERERLRGAFQSIPV